MNARPAAPVQSHVIALVRVDNRLLHGQILETWIPALGARRVVVADDDVAGNTLARTAMTLCLPPGLDVEVVPVDRVPWTSLAAAKEPVFVLVREIGSLARARTTGMAPSEAPRVNVGNIHFAAGRRPVTPSVFLSEEELRTLRDMASAGFLVEARAIPREPPAGMAEIERRYAAGR
jgi:PTS system mannose-specific IIB component